MALDVTQITIGAGKSRAQSASLPCRQVIVQNNAANTCRVGGPSVTTSKGMKLDPSSGGLAGGSLNSAFDMGAVDLNEVWVAGTQGDVIDVYYVV